MAEHRPEARGEQEAAPARHRRNGALLGTTGAHRLPSRGPSHVPLGRSRWSSDFSLWLADDLRLLSGHF